MAKTKAELRATGLTGSGVPSSVEELLSALPGVGYVHVNLGASKIHVDYDDSLLSVEALLTALRQAGIGSRSVRDLLFGRAPCFNG